MKIIPDQREIQNELEGIMQNKLCLVCGKSKIGPHLQGLLKCESCGFVTANLTMDELNFNKIYGREYFFGNEYVDYVQDKKVLQRNFKKRIKSILKYKRNGFLVDVGCAYGFFLEVAKEYFEVKGYEICQDAVDFARSSSLDVVCDDFSKAYIPKNSMDVITMWDVIEHLPDPQSYVVKSNAILKQNGLLCITTGDIGSFNARLRKQKWRMLHPPTHLYYFSKETLRLFLEKNGFQILQEEYISLSRSIRQIAYSVLMSGKKKHGNLYKLLEKLYFTQFKLSLNLRDIIYVIAAKNRSIETQ